MSTALLKTGSLVTVDGDDPFRVVFAPAQPALDAARKLKQLRSLADLPMLDIKHAEQHRDAAIERCELIPEDAIMYRARRRFEAAEHEPAPEPWLHAAIGLTLDSIPSARDLPPSYRYGLVDLLMDDDSNYEPGFSYAVVAEASREVRRISSDLPPSQAAFLEACVKARAGFRKLVSCSDQLIATRQGAEDILIELGILEVPEEDNGLTLAEMEAAFEKWVAER
jgi:hypothetical protein